MHSPGLRGNDRWRLLSIVAAFAMVTTVLASVILMTGTASAAEPPVIYVTAESLPSQGGDRVFIHAWTPNSNVTVEVWDSTAKTTLVESANATTNSTGHEIVYFTDLKVGQFVVVDGGGVTKEVELVNVTGAIDVFTDKVAGTAPPGAFVEVGAPGCRLTYADAGGMWEVDFSVPDNSHPDCTEIIDIGLGDVGGVLAFDGDDDGTGIDIEVHDFTDDNGTTFEMDITWLYQEGITKGCNPPVNDQYCPNGYVTRGQMAAFLVRALNYTDAGAGDLFTDDDGIVFESAIDKLGTAGVTKGCNPPDNDLFCPDGYVTRGQMAAFLVRALNYTDAGAGDLFTDDDGLIFESAIDKLGTAGVTKGCNPPVNDQFCPHDNVTRGQMAAFLRRALG